MRMQKIPTHKERCINNTNNELLYSCSVTNDGVTKTVKKWNVATSVEKQVTSPGSLCPSPRKKAGGWSGFRDGHYAFRKKKPCLPNSLGVLS